MLFYEMKRDKSIVQFSRKTENFMNIFTPDPSLQYITPKEKVK